MRTKCQKKSVPNSKQQMQMADIDEDYISEEDDILSSAPEEHEHWRIEVDKGQNAVRIDKFLMDHMGDTSRNRIQKAAEAGCIRVNDFVLLRACLQPRNLGIELVLREHTASCDIRCALAKFCADLVAGQLAPCFWSSETAIEGFHIGFPFAVPADL